MKIYRCGLCKEEKRYNMTRYGLRKHLREEHRILNNITNSWRKEGKHKTREKYIKQRWWITEEVK